MLCLLRCDVTKHSARLTFISLYLSDYYKMISLTELLMEIEETFVFIFLPDIVCMHVAD